MKCDIFCKYHGKKWLTQPSLNQHGDNIFWCSKYNREISETNVTKGIPPKWCKTKESEISEYETELLNLYNYERKE